ncbi:MAG: lytic transglycosylase domain-containing protein [Candidatus Kapabacteria bacterium]|nr:lytic transglycosylase domain-containing protein [Candidatus Kapabacteria bacterium]
MRSILLFITAIVVISCTESNDLRSNQIDTQSHFEFLSTVEFPTELSWCGEKVPLDDPEVRERAEREFYMLLQQPGQIILYLKRSGRFFPMFEKIISENNMPDDLKYLAVAESALYQAKSSVGAIGLWQFMPATAKLMGLQVDDNIDERRHPEKSTRAAMKYLKDGYKNHKSWMLTAAGYNMGHSGVQSNLSFQSTDNYFDLHLNEETSRFIFRIAIIKHFMQNAEKYGFKLKKSDLYPPDEYDIVKVGSAVPDLSAWAKSMGYNYKQVKMLNPWILKRSLPNPPKGKVFEVAVPKK